MARLIFQDELGLKKNFRTRKWKKEMMIPLVKELVSKHGQSALSSTWLCKNGYSGFLDAIQREYGTWIKLKEAAGFPSKKIKTFRDWDKDELIPFLKSKVEEYGDQAKSSNWFENNGHSSFVKAVRENYDRSWPKFLEKAGLSNYWNKKDLVPHMNKLLEKHGDKALSCEWILKKTKLVMVDS